MTQEELKEYNELTQEGKDLYNMGMRYHPEWSHGQAMTYVAINISFPILPPQPPEPNGLRDLYLNIVHKADGFLKMNFPRVYQQVQDTFNKIYDWLVNAASVTIKKILDFFN